MNKADLLAILTKHFPDMPAAALAIQSLATLSNEEFSYHLPAFMVAALQAPVSATSAAVVLALKLPIELHAATVIASIRRHEAASPEMGPEALLRSQLTQTNAAIHQFIARATLFSQMQAATIYHFLAYLRDKHGSAFPNHEPARAIERYWFQFAESGSGVSG